MSAPRRSTLSQVGVVFVFAFGFGLAASSEGCSSSPNGPADGSFTRDAGAIVSDAPADGALADGAGREVPVVDAPADIAGGGANPRCPASFTARAEGETCYTILSACDYPEGRCGCQVCEAAPQGFGYIWSCRRWDSGGVSCPARSPAVGSPCDGLGLQCRYGAYCGISVGDDLQCLDGTWQPAVPLEACGYRTCPS